MSLFNTGYDGLEEAQERQKRMGSRIYNFILKEGETDVHFLTESPVTFDAHSVRKVKNGKEFFETVVCTGKGCKHCEDTNPTFKGAYLVYDYGTYVNKDKKEVENGIRLYVQGVTVLAQLKRLSEKYGLTNREYTIIRTGKEKSTSYSFDRGEKSEITEEEIREALPDAFADVYDGTEESLLEIVKSQVELMLPKSVSSDDEDDEEEDDIDDTIIGIDDDDDDDGVKFNSRLKRDSNRRGSSTSTKSAGKRKRVARK